MPRLVWDSLDSKPYLTGIEKGVLGIQGEVIPWNGLISVSEEPTNKDVVPLYQNAFRTHNYILTQNYLFGIESFTYPDEVQDILDEKLENRFDFSYKKSTGNNSYNLHIIYNCSLESSKDAYHTDTALPENVTFSWSIESSFYSDQTGFYTSSHLTLDSKLVDSEKLKLIEEILYGSEESLPRIPTIFEILYILRDEPFYEVDIASNTGLYPLVESGVTDLMGYPSEGLYRKPPSSRLTDKNFLPGLNQVE